MRISVYLKGQNSLTEPASHETSRKLAALIVLQCARVIGQNAIQLTTDESWREVKERMKHEAVRASNDALRTSNYDSAFDGGAIRPFDYDLIPFNYPVGDQRTVSV